MAEDRIDVLTRDLRNALVKDDKWGLRSKEFKAFVGGLFIMKPVAKRQAAFEKRKEKLEIQVRFRLHFRHFI